MKHNDGLIPSAEASLISEGPRASHDCPLDISSTPLIASMLVCLKVQAGVEPAERYGHAHCIGQCCLVFQFERGIIIHKVASPVYVLPNVIESGSGAIGASKIIMG